MTDTARPIAYLKRSCPHCLRLRIFLTEAGLGDRVDYVVFDDGDDTHRSLRARMEDAGQQPSFPAVAFDGDRLETGTDDLIARLARGLPDAAKSLPLLRHYEEGVFKCYGEMFRELKALKTDA